MALGSDLSERQVAILGMLRDYLVEYDYPPTIREIGEAVGISSTSVVTYNLGVLERKGYIQRNRDISRGLRLSGDWYAEEEEALETEPMQLGALVSIPLLGAIAAGEPIPVPDSIAPSGTDTITLSTDLIDSAEQVYALEVHGDSMTGDMINDGDIVVMRHQTSANNGDTVAAWLKGDKATTLKRIYQQPGSKSVRLQPANPAMQPFEVPANDVEIQGRVICVIRRLA